MSLADIRGRLFRKAAIDRISSPEQLDQLVTIAGARAWLAVAGLGVLLVVAAVWGVAGRVPTTVPANGIIVAEGGRVLAAMSPATGVLKTVAVRLGEDVRKGQPIGEIRQMEAEVRLDNAQATAAMRERELERRRGQLLKELELKRAMLQQRTTALRQSMLSARERVGYLEKQVANRQEMLSMGFATAERIQEAQNELNLARKEVADGQAQLIAADADAMAAQVAVEGELARLQAEVDEARQRVAELQTSLGETAFVVAPADGRVTEIKATDGAMVGQGEPVVAIETSGATLQAVVYVPTEHGKKVRPDLVVRIAPAAIKKEEHGMLLGRVRSISPFPATRQGISAVVQNDSLVETYTKEGAPYEARIDLIPAATPSGYAWTSGQGPAIELTSGTTVEASVTVREQRPVELVLPFLRALLGGA